MVLYLRMENEESERDQPTENSIAIYSKTAILWFSIFFSPVVGGILLMLNLRSVGYKKEGSMVLYFSIAYRILSVIALNYFVKMPQINVTNPDFHALIKPFTYSLALDIIGGGILAEYFFKKYFPDNDYERKSITRPLIIVILIAIPLGLLFGV